MLPKLPRSSAPRASELTTGGAAQGHQHSMGSFFQLSADLQLEIFDLLDFADR